MADTTTTTQVTVDDTMIDDLIKRASLCEQRLSIRAEIRADEVKRYNVHLNHQNYLRVTMRRGVKQAGEFTYETAISLLVECLRDGLIGLGAGAMLLNQVAPLVIVPVTVAL